MPKQRADVALVERGFFESRARAQEAIAAGLVFADGKPVRKPSETILEQAKLQAEAPHPWVSRGGVKLDAALETFPVPVSGCTALDIGSSTGGFSHVLLSRGARHVVAVDVGHDQFHKSLRNDPRVDLREGTDARNLRAEDLPQPPSVLTFDVSFIPLKPVLSHVLPLAAAGAWMVALVKPQFEVGRQHLKKGIVRDGGVREMALMELHSVVEDLGWTVEGAMPSPITGGDGNVEFLLVARLRTPSV